MYRTLQIQCISQPVTPGINAFDVDTVHAQCHNGEPPASLVCEGGAPQRLVLGLKGANASKNGFFAEIPLDTAVLPEVAHLVIVCPDFVGVTPGIRPYARCQIVHTRLKFPKPHTSLSRLCYAVTCLHQFSKVSRNLRVVGMPYIE